MKFIQEYAGENSCSLYEALCRNLDQDIFKGTKAGEFVQLIESFAANYQDRPVSEILSLFWICPGMRECCAQRGTRRDWTIWQN